MMEMPFLFGWSEVNMAFKKVLEEFRPGDEFSKVFKPLLFPFWVFCLCCLGFVGCWIIPWLLPISLWSLLPIVLYLRDFLYRFEQLTATQEGLTFRNKTDSLSITWAQLRDIEPVRGGYLFRTAAGDWKMGRWFEVWSIAQICKSFAPHVDIEYAKEAMPGAPRVGEVPHFFFSRMTSVNFVSIQMAQGCLLALLIAFIILELLPPELSNPNAGGASTLKMFALFFLGLGGGTFWAWHSYKRGAIVVDENSLEFRGLWKTRRIPWAQIESYGSREGQKHYLKVDGRQLYLG